MLTPIYNAKISLISSSNYSWIFKSTRLFRFNICYTNLSSVLIWSTRYFLGKTYTCKLFMYKLTLNIHVHYCHNYTAKFTAFKAAFVGAYTQVY